MRVILFFVFLQTVFHSNAQSIIGLWQQGSPEVSAAYLNTYEFKSDGTFKFNTSGYFGLSRIESIGGKYKVTKNEIKVSVEYMIEMIGGKIERSEFAGEATHSWVIDGGQLKKNVLDKPVKSSISFEFGKSKKAEEAKTEMILLDKSEFYKINQ